VHDDRAQPLALDDGRRLVVERDAHAQRGGAVQKLARECDGARELRAFGRRFAQKFFRELSCPRRAPAGNFALWMLT
jgi:hypothetical protein